MDESPKEACGLFGMYGVPEAAAATYAGLFSLQHRGQEGAGIVISDRKHVRSIKGLGLLTQVFAKRAPTELKGDISTCALFNNRISETTERSTSHRGMCGWVVGHRTQWKSH